MKMTLSKLSAAGLAIVALFSACQKEPSERLELIAEGMGGGTKMYVNDLASYWQTGDKVNINGTESTVTVSGSQAYVDGEFSADNYYIVFPSSFYQSRTGDMVTVDMPATYQYGTVTVGGQRRQVLNAPLAYIGDANGGKATMRHLTGAINVQISGPDNIVVDRITIGTTQNRVMSGEMQFDLSDIDNIGSSATNVNFNNTIQMLFENTSFSTGTVQIPIPVLNGNVNFTVKVEAHLFGTKHTFERTQTTGGHLGRGVIGTVAVNLNSDQPNVTTSALFGTTILNGKTYYTISSAHDMRMLVTATYGSTLYDEDHDPYNVKWEYNDLKYVDANYLVTQGFDMEGIEMRSIDGLTGEFNGGGHTISNIVARATRKYSGDSTPWKWGLFTNCKAPIIENLTIAGLTIDGEHSDGMQSYAGALFAERNYNYDTITISNVHITDFMVRKNSTYGLVLGGFVGVGGKIKILNSSVSFAPGQNINSYYALRNTPPAVLGGVSAFNHVPVLDNVTVDFGTIGYSTSNSRVACCFGGVTGRLLSNDGNKNWNDVTVSGNVTISATTTYKAKIYCNQNYELVDTYEGVDVSGLTIN